MDAHKKQLEEQDYLMHVWWGSYGLSAVAVAVEHCLAGKKAKSCYVEKPIMSEMKEKPKENTHLTEEEKKKQTEQLFMRLKIMGANHKRNNKSKDSTMS